MKKQLALLAAAMVGSMVKLKSIGEVKTASDGRAYYTAEFQDPQNPFAKPARRNFWQQFADSVNRTNPEWRGANPAEVKSYVGKSIPGAILNATVEPYEIGDRTITQYTTVVLSSESIASVFKNAGHALASEEEVAETAPVATEEEAVIS